MIADGPAIATPGNRRMNIRAWFWLGLIAVTVVGGVIRFAPLGDRPLWYDEADTWAASIDGASKPLPYARFFQWENHFETAPLSFLFVRIATDLTGNDSEVSMRLPSLILGTLCIPLMFLLGKVVQGYALGLTAAALTAFDPNMVDQSQQARMYMVMMFFTIIAIIWSIHLLRNPKPAGVEGGRLKNVLHWLGLGVVFGLLLWTQQFTAAVWVGIAIGVGGLLVAGWVTKQPHEQPWSVLIGFTSAFIVGLIVAFTGVYKLVTRVFGGGDPVQGDGADLSLIDITKEIATAAKDLIGWGPAGLIVYPLALLGIILLFRKCKSSVAILIGVAIANVLILYPFRKMHHFLDGRYLSLMQPMVFIGLGMLTLGFARRPWRLAGCVVVGVLVVAGVWRSTHLTNYYMQPDRYLFANQIVMVRDAMKEQPADQALIHPGPAYILAKYYDLPQDMDLYTSFYDPVTTQPIQTGALPPDFDAPAVWLVMGMNNYDGRITKAKALLEQFARHYEVAVDETELSRHLALGRVAAARVSSNGITYHSMWIKP